MYVIQIYFTPFSYLIIVAPPQIFLDESYKDKVVLNVGTSAVIEIPISGSPQPKLSWQFNDDLLYETRRVKTETTATMTCLRIARAERSDTGSYKLALSNVYGKASITIKVIVLGKNLINNLFYLFKDNLIMSV